MNQKITELKAAVAAYAEIYQADADASEASTKMKSRGGASGNAGMFAAALAWLEEEEAIFANGGPAAQAPAPVKAVMAA